MSKHSGTLHKGETGREWNEKYEGGDSWAGSGTSIFDPVLCELAYTWFCPNGGTVLDPFAGGSVRGIVAAELGYKYTGVELRHEQVVSNEAQAKEICKEREPLWLIGDSREEVPKLDGLYDFVFSCPPYGDLEVYSDDEADLSNMGYEEFKGAYWDIIHHSVARLKDNSFACFVVGDFRDKRGNYRNFVSDTIAGFLTAGCHLYNDAVLLTALGSLPIRAGKQFSASRKLGKTHQNVLVFVKGDGKAAAERCGHVEVAELDND
jgi:hypothetical protein